LSGKFLIQIRVLDINEDGGDCAPLTTASGVVESFDVVVVVVVVVVVIATNEASSPLRLVFRRLDDK
jgi:hypothetical protein